MQLILFLLFFKQVVDDLVQISVAERHHIE